MEMTDILYENLTSSEIAAKIKEGYMAALPCGCGAHRLEPVAGEAKRKAREQGKQVNIFTPRVDLHSIMKREWHEIKEWHAGESTTSILLAKWPEAVRIDKIHKEARSRPFRWDEAFMTDEVAPDGDSGRPGSYSKEKGEKVWQQSVEAAAQIFKDIWELVQNRK